jgi:predicted PurR-regulated permease PerM
MRDGESRSFVTFLAVVTLAAIWIALPFYGAILWGLVAAIMFDPLFRRLVARWPKRRTTAALLTVLALIAIVIIPAGLIGSLLIEESISTYGRIQSRQIDFGRVKGDVRAALPASLTATLDRFGLGDVASIQLKLSTFVSSGLRMFATQAVNFGQGAFALVLQLGVMLYLTFFFLRDGRSLSRAIGARVPLDPARRAIMFEKFTTVIRATIKGSVVIAIIQGVIGGVVFWALGIHAPLLWGVVMGLLSLLPAIGTGLIWVPVAIALFASGDIVEGGILVFCGVFIIGMVDNVLRPILVGKDTRMPDFVVLIATLGGISVIGINGFIIGPVIAALFIAAWDSFTPEVG